MGFSTFGRHVVGDFYGVSGEVLNNRKLLREILFEAAKACDATVVAENFAQFEPQGVTGVLVLAESHLSIHTYPEHGFCAIDCYTCGEDVDPQKAYNYLLQRLKPQKAFRRGLERGQGEIKDLLQTELKVVNS